MAASLSSLQAVLKNFYAAAVAEQLNQEVLMLELFEKAKLDWSGKRVIIPVHVGRNQGVGFAAEGAALPTAGQEIYSELNVTAKFLYGRFQISGPAISSAKGAYSFGNYIDLELRKLVEDVRKRANVACFSGNIVLGYVHRRIDNANATVVYPFSGDLQELARKRTAAIAAGQQLVIELRRTDTYGLVFQGGGGLIAEGFISAVDFGADTISITTTAADRMDTTLASNAGLEPTAGFAVVIKAGVSTVGTAAFNEAVLELNGIATNLSSPLHFGVDRTDATGGFNVALQTNSITTQNVTGVDANYDPFAALTLGRMQQVTDSIYTDSGVQPDIIMLNPAQRQSYTNLLVGANAANLFKITDSAKNGDGGFSGLGFNGIPLKVSVDAGQHIFYFLHTKVWKLAELEKPGFADLDGNILARAGVGAGGIDAYEGYYRLYCDVYCERPNANGAIIGVAF